MKSFARMVPSSKVFIQSLLALALTLFSAARVSAAPASAPSVYQVKPSVDGAIVAGELAAVVLANSNANSWVRSSCPCDPNGLNSLDRMVVGHRNDYFKSVSDLSLVTAVIFPIFLDWHDVGTSEQLKEDMIVYAETLTTNESLTTLAKFRVARPRPINYEPNSTGSASRDDYMSFYSGHTSTVFAALTNAAYTRWLRHPEDRWPWYLAALGGASVGYDRVQAGKHFYTDVIAGAAAGALTGWLVPRAHRLSSGAKEEHFSLALLPVEGGGFVMFRSRF